MRSGPGFDLVARFIAAAEGYGSREPAHAHANAGNEPATRGSFADPAAAIPKLDRESARCARVAASASSPEHHRGPSRVCGCVCFSSWALSSRSLTLSIARAASFSCFSNGVSPRNARSQFLQAGALPTGPLGLQPPFFFGEILGGAHGFALQRFEFVAAAIGKRSGPRLRAPPAKVAFAPGQSRRECPGVARCRCRSIRRGATIRR